MILCENFSHIPKLEYCFYSSFVLVLVVLNPAPRFPICHKRRCLLWSWKTGEDSFQRRKSFLNMFMHSENVYFDRFWNPLFKDQRTSAFKELASQVKTPETINFCQRVNYLSLRCNVSWVCFLGTKPLSQG